MYEVELGGCRNLFLSENFTTEFGREEECKITYTGKKQNIFNVE
jgi:hypothetical protein